jgi:DNA-binding protein HU-beta
VGRHRDSNAADSVALSRIVAAQIERGTHQQATDSAPARARAYKKRHLLNTCNRKTICAEAAVCYVARRFVNVFTRYASTKPALTYTRGDSAMAKKGGAPTKSEILAQVSKDTELSRKQVSEVFESLNGIIKKSLRGNGLFTLPGLLKLKVVKRPATKARDGVNPFTGEKMTFKAKPASKKVRALPLKNLKAFVN